MVHYHKQLIDGNNFEVFDIYDNDQKIGWLRKEVDFYYLNIFYRDYKIKRNNAKQILNIVDLEIMSRDSTSLIKIIREAQANKENFPIDIDNIKQITHLTIKQ